MPGRIVIACDATKSHSKQELKTIITSIRSRNGMIQEVDTITVLGVLHKLLHPMGFEMPLGSDSFMGARMRAIKENVSRIIDAYVRMLHCSAEECDGDGVNIEVRIVVGTPLKNVVVNEALTSNATWVVLNRHLRKESRFYLKHIPCKMAAVLDTCSLEVSRPHCSDKSMTNLDQKLFFSLSKIVPLLPADNEQSLISPSFQSICSQESSDTEKSSAASLLTPPVLMEQNLLSPKKSNSNSQLQESGNQEKVKDNYDSSPPVSQKENGLTFSDASVHSTDMQMKSDIDSGINDYFELRIEAADFSSSNLPREDNGKDGRKSGNSYVTMRKQTDLKSDDMQIEIDLMKWSYSKIQTATSNFSSDNLLGEGRYGAVYKGQLRVGQPIVVKVRKEANAQGCSEFQSEVHALSMVRHVNVVMLLGHCLKENQSILVYEFICNKSLAWHLFGDSNRALEWHRRYAIAIGIAKGLRYLHEECRGAPVIHRDLRPSNIFLSHEFVPMLGDFGLAKGKTNAKYDKPEKVLSTLGYLAPEYAENGTCSVKTDVFAYGIVLLQLISGRNEVDPTGDSRHKSLRQWAMPLIERVALDELVDPWLGDSYGMYELYQMARLAYLCIQTKPDMRPAIGEVLHRLEAKDEHLHHLTK